MAEDVPDSVDQWWCTALMLSRHCTARASLIVALLGGCGMEEPDDPARAKPSSTSALMPLEPP